MSQYAVTQLTATQIEIIKKSDLFIGTYSTNIGMFLGLSMPANKIYALDYENWVVF